MMLDPTVAHLVEEAMVFGGVIIVVIAASVVTMVRSKARRETQGDVDVVARLDEISARLGHLETSVDASSLEIERISEGQRFTTRLLAERNAVDQTAARAGRPGSP
jgi:hypothetical protein